MESLLQVVLIFVYLVSTSAHDQLPQSIPVGHQGGQQIQQAQSPQLYIGQSSNDYGNNQSPSTTVCVEIRSNPNYKICGPEVPQSPGIYQQYPNQGYYQTNSPLKKEEFNKDNSAQQAQQSEQKPLISNQRGLLVQPPYIPVQQVFRMPQPSNLMVAKQYIPSSHQNSITTDGTLSMNCKVGGLKLSNFPSSSQSFPSSYNNMYRFMQPPLALFQPNSYKTIEMDPSWMDMMPKRTNDASSMDSSVMPTQTMDMETRKQLMNELAVEVAQETKNLMELKKQIAELNKLTNQQSQQRDSSNMPKPEKQSQNPTDKPMNNQQSGVKHTSENKNHMKMRK